MSNLKDNDFESRSVKPVMLLASFLAVGILFLAPRLWKLDQFVTVDEPRWLSRSANFLMAMRLGNWEVTYQKEHPGVTVMWAGAVGHFLEGYPILFEHGDYFVDPADLERHLTENNEAALARLTSGRAVLILFSATISILAYYFAGRLLGWRAAFLGFVFIAFSPFLIAHQRLLHLDGLLSALIILALLSGANYLYNGRRRIDLVVSGMAAGLAFITKSPGLILVPVFGLLGLVQALGSADGLSPTRRLRRITLEGSAWLLVALLVVVALWPAMWVDPLGTLTKVFQGAAGYAEAGHDSAVFFSGRIYTDARLPWYFYPLTYLWRSTPLALLGLSLAGLGLLLSWGDRTQAANRRSLLVLLGFAVVFTGSMALGEKQFDRYLLPIFPALALVAGYGVDYALREARATWQSAQAGRRKWSWVVAALAAMALFAWQVVSVVRSAPYFFTYYNPVLRAIQPVEDVMMIGWGEGLDAAARLLNNQPGAEGLRALSWYPDGAFSYFFDGETIRTDMPVDVYQLPNVHYLVIYIHQYQRRLPSQAFLDYVRLKEPEYIVELNGIRYVEVYRIPDTAYNLENDFVGWPP